MKIVRPFFEALKSFSFLSGEKNDFSELKVPENRGLLLPPFLGEMGHEVQFFLAAIEPWLRSGWKIYARRPELYPKGSAFFEPALFEQVDALMLKFDAHPQMNAITVNKTRPPPPNIALFEKERHKVFHLTVNNDAFDEVVKVRAFEQALKKVIAPYVLSPSRPSTFWDDYLTSAFILTSDVFLPEIQRPIPPASKPYLYQEGDTVIHDHIGIQLRNYRDATRNSDVPSFLRAAEQASALLGKPILVYGNPKGTHQPPGYLNTAALSSERGVSLLSYELQALRNCSLMFAPYSGWADLMAWLQVPTLIENSHGDGLNLCRLAVFEPRMAFLEKNEEVPPQVTQLLSSGPGIRPPKNDPTPKVSFTVPAGFNNAAFF